MTGRSGKWKVSFRVKTMSVRGGKAIPRQSSWVGDLFKRRRQRDDDDEEEKRKRKRFADREIGRRFLTSVGNLKVR